MACGFTGQSGIDYEEIFAHFAQMYVSRTLLAVATIPTVIALPDACEECISSRYNL